MFNKFSTYVFEKQIKNDIVEIISSPDLSKLQEMVQQAAVLAGHPVAGQALHARHGQARQAHPQDGQRVKS